MNCNGLHCPGCGHGSKGGSGVVPLIVGLVIFATAGPAIAAGARELVHILIVAAIVLLSVAVTAGIIAGAVWYHRRTLRAPVARAQLPVVIRELGPPEPRAIEPAHLRADVAAEVVSLRAEVASLRAERNRARWPHVAPYRTDGTGGDR